jgi:DNA-binding response OmpR family regulator
MSHPVLVFSADKIRGGITQRILKRSGFEVLLLSRILGARAAVANHAPRVVIFDTNSCYSDEINHIKNLCRTLDHTNVIVLGDPSVIEGFEGPGLRKELCLSDPMDPELVATRVREVLYRNAKEKTPEKDSLEQDLEQLLKLA